MAPDPLSRYVTEYGDWGNEHMRAYGVPELWKLHIQHCARCRKVQDTWDRQAAEEKRAAERAKFDAGIDRLFEEYEAAMVEQAIEEFNAWQDGGSSA